LEAEALVILSNVPGLLRDPADEDSLISRIPRLQAQEHLDRYAKGRMKRKILGAIEALDNDVGKVIIADGRVDRPVQRALAGRGTVIA
jgi:acetylglutamate/LysW-gamma-L-alpha-aminoadipate kinase